jgi:TM2 domain-containing membrane protein YozV
MATPPPQNTKYCVNCGAQIDARAEICPKCGVRVAPPPSAVQPQPVTTQHKNEGLAAILSFIFVGLGQIYNGQIGKGLLFLIIGIIFAALIIILIGIPLYIILWIYNIYDAYNTAKKINAGLIKT